MAISIVQQKSGTGNSASSVITLDSTPTPGNLLVILAVEIQSGAATWGTHTIGGSPGGNFTGRGSPSRGTLADRVVASGDNTSVTIVQTGTAGIRIFVFELSGMDTTTPFDQGNGTTFSAGTSVATPLSGATAQADEFVAVIAGLNGNGGGDVSASDGFTLWTLTTDSRRIGAYKTLTSIGTPNPTLTWSISRAGQYVIAAWKMASAAPKSLPPGPSRARRLHRIGR